MKGMQIIELMGTVIKMTVFHDEAERLLDEAETMLRSYNHRFSANDDTSELMKINHQAGIEPVVVNQELFELIALGKRHSLSLDSYLNIAIGPLVQTWRIGFKDATVPDSVTIKELLSLTNPEDIVLSENSKTVYLSKKGMKIDLGSIAKGYIADKIKEFFVLSGVSSGLINLGGNVLTIGINHATSEAWKVGVQDPNDKRGKTVCVVALTDMAMVTSGIYERKLIVEGKEYHHIFDRTTGYPVATEVASITIIAKRAVDCEVWTTRLFGYEPSEIIHRIDCQEGIEGIVLTKDNHSFVSSALRKS